MQETVERSSIDIESNLYLLEDHFFSPLDNACLRLKTIIHGAFRSELQKMRKLFAIAKISRVRVSRNAVPMWMSWR